MLVNTIYIHYFKTPYGELILGSFQDKLCLADWRYRKMRTTIDNRIKKYFKASFIEKEDAIIKLAKKQLTSYFEKKRTSFNIPLIFAGTNFQQSVWHALIDIPFGTTNSYLELSKVLDNEKAIRAVAAANGANAISIIVPCHRIIGSNGKLIGYAGGLATKKKLLLLENALKTDQLRLF